MEEREEIAMKKSARTALETRKYTDPPRRQAGTSVRRPSAGHSSLIMVSLRCASQRRAKERAGEPGAKPLALHFDPTAGCAGAEQRVDDPHVLNRVLQRIRRRSVLHRRAREEIALNRVLVARGELDDMLVRHSTRWRVFHKNAAGAIGWGIERNLDFDAPDGARDRDPLRVRELRAAGAHGMPSVEVQHDRRHVVDPRVGVFLNQGTNTPRFRFENHSGGVDEITA